MEHDNSPRQGPNDRRMHHASEFVNVPGQPLRKRSLSTPHALASLNSTLHAYSPSRNAELSKDDKKKKKHLSFLKLFSRKKTSPTSGTTPTDLSQQELFALEMNQRETELKFARTLMEKPNDFCRTDSEPDMIQTVCSPNNFSSETIQLDKRLYQIDVSNSRVATLNRLAETSVLKDDYEALEFLNDSLKYLRKHTTRLFIEVDKYLTRFKQDTSLLLSHSDRLSHTSSVESDSSDNEGDRVRFHIHDDHDLGDSTSTDLRWERHSLSISADNTSDESDEEGPSVSQVQDLAREVRKAEGTRFKRKFRSINHRRRTSEESDLGAGPYLPPPPNPLGHTQRALMRSHVTVPSGLCQQGHRSGNSFNTLQGAQEQQQQQQHGRHKVVKHAGAPTLPFNMLSLTGQLSWLISEYIPRQTSTYRWASDLNHQISSMFGSKTTWLNMHQQLRETTELLYAHRGRNALLMNSTTAKGEIAWNELLAMHQALEAAGDSNAATVTAETSHKFLIAKDQLTMEPGLYHLTALLESKLHLAYVCDLVLWRAHRVLFEHETQDPRYTAQHQLIDFRIRHMQLRLDQANIQNWSPELSDRMTCWAHRLIVTPARTGRSLKDRFCLNELKSLKMSINRFHVLVKHLCDSELLADDYLDHEVSDPLSDTVSQQSSATSVSSISPQTNDQHHPHHHHHHHHHPHTYHHGEGGHQQDLRPLDADRCSHTYAELIHQVHDHAMAQRPLVYFAQRALYDTALELGCKVDWRKRLTALLEELDIAFAGWDLLLKTKLGTEFCSEREERHTPEAERR